jgi:hypothetical protein
MRFVHDFKYHSLKIALRRSFMHCDICSRWSWKRNVVRNNPVDGLAQFENDLFWRSCFARLRTADVRFAFNCSGDRMPKTRLLLTAIPVPGEPPDPVKVRPAKSRQNLLTQSVAVSRNARRVVHRTVAFNSKNVATCLRGMFHGEIDPVICASNLRDDIVSSGTDHPGHLLLEGALRVAAIRTQIDTEAGQTIL